MQNKPEITADVWRYVFIFHFIINAVLPACWPTRAWKNAVNNVIDRPKFICPKSKIVGMSETEVSLTCRVHAEPPVTGVRFRWRRQSSKDDVILDAGEQNGHYSAELINGVRILIP